MFPLGMMCNLSWFAWGLYQRHRAGLYLDHDESRLDARHIMDGIILQTTS
jgi:hypothetical protein